MEFKVVISDPKTGKSYQQEIKDEKANRFVNLKIGGEADGTIVGLPGYKIRITGGSDSSGFPMKRGIEGGAAKKILVAGGVGYNPARSVRRKKRVRGAAVTQETVQINTKIVEYGKKSVEELLGVQKEPKEGEKADAGKEQA
ncbi:MAG: 30S ribosomal protein S6e [Candidatus Altiarchaeota archaeon]